MLLSLRAAMRRRRRARACSCRPACRVPPGVPNGPPLTMRGEWDTNESAVFRAGAGGCAKLQQCRRDLCRNFFRQASYRIAYENDPLKEIIVTTFTANCSPHGVCPGAGRLTQFLDNKTQTHFAQCERPR